MAFVAFLLGLAVGLGLFVVQRLWLNRQYKSLLRTLPDEGLGDSLPALVRLRRAIAIANQHQHNLTEQLLTWQQILQVAPVGYLQVDEENQLLWCNQQARQLLSIQNWEPERSRLLLKVVRSYELDYLIEQTRTNAQPSQREWVFHPAVADAEAMGRVRSLTLRGYSWPLPNGQVGVFLENRQDAVTLIQTRNRWVSDLAHELRTPLTSIRLVAEALQLRLEPPTRTWVERMLGETNRLIKLVQDWLDLISIEADPSKNLSLKVLEVHSLIQTAWQTLEPLARPKQLNFVYSGPTNISLVADESRLMQVFLNLFDNSIRYSGAGETVQVEVKLLPSLENPINLQIDLIDTGPGFPDTDLAYVFDRLYRGEPSRVRNSSIAPEQSEQSRLSTVSNGSGLGLAIVRQIIIAHGGEISAQNHPRTGGAWLKIILPYVKEEDLP
ncbi:PAS domain-containing sensor histidine kinase [Ancylothrix sp. C2]|uniref:sensor histidine kinase n=1 Tax=Ancylothrix sp. D3o TaxID=2953691 RepID=UPI0021BB4BCF|nr:PAS domain-containing sensor histidine kinase [Ancylothrix sp. D3o]MCT7950324.1 PAS domain-containing sensor histidine kinase [Ancylothrix sp. D3o]